MVDEKPKNNRKYVVVGNWKCNGTVDWVRQFCTHTLNTMRFTPEKVEVVVAPVFIHIASAKAMLNTSVHIATQNISANKNGPFTGEVSAE